MKLLRLGWFSLLLLTLLPYRISAASSYQMESALPGDKALIKYFERETRLLEDRCLADIQDLETWNAKLGLWPLPKRTDLKATITGKTEHDAFTVEKLHFQALPGLYVTADLYVPK